jgi:Flp pilus assembly protein TadD
MSDISLREYLAKLESALYAGSADEVIHHCRHILQFYPKNVAAYRFLGRALLYNARYEESSAALRRVLSVAPDDYSAHFGLSESYDRLGRGDESIWHLERAFEQQPNNRDLIDALRALYRRYRQMEPKIQLTNAAVARQHIANRRYDQAIEALRNALSRSPDRVDLKVMLAYTLWEHGDDVAGAEAALDVLEVLPDCLEANAILTELWLEEDRPSDAQRYLNRVEAVDPYRALELAQGDAPDDAFRLEELDYQRAAKTELSSARPDWLTQVTGGESAASAPASSEPDVEWSRWTSGLLSGSETDAPDAVPKPVPVDADPFPLMQTSPDFDPFADLPALPAAESILNTPDDDNPLAWMRDSGIEIFDEDPAPPQFDDDFRVEFDAQSPTAWMTDDVVMADPPAFGALIDNNQDDSMDWLRDAAPDAALLPDSITTAPVDAPAPVYTPQPTVPDWLNANDDDALTEAFGIEQLTSGSANEPDADSFNPFPDLELLTTSQPASSSAADEPEFNLDFDFASADVTAAPAETLPDWMNTPAYPLSAEEPDNFNPKDDTLPVWMRAEGDAAAPAPPPETTADALPDWMQAARDPASNEPDLFAADTPNASADDVSFTAPGARKGLTGLLNNAANLDWLKNQPEPEPAPPQDDWMGLFNDTPTETVIAPDAAPDWLNALDEDAEPSAAPVLPDAPPAQPTEMEFAMPSDHDFDWLPRHPDDPQQADAFTPPAPSDEPTPNDQFDWLSVSETPDEALDTSNAEVADLSWLTNLDSGDAPQPPAPEPEVSATPSPVELPTDLPDWLMNMQPTETPEEIASEQMIAEGDLSFLDQPAAAPADDLSFLTEMPAQPDILDAEPDFSFLDDMPDQAETATAQPDFAFLNEPPPQPQTSSAERDFAFLSQLDDQPEASETDLSFLDDAESDDATVIPPEYAWENQPSFDASAEPETSETDTPLTMPDLSFLAGVDDVEQQAEPVIADDLSYRSEFGMQPDPETGANDEWVPADPELAFFADSDSADAESMMATPQPEAEPLHVAVESLEFADAPDESVETVNPQASMTPDDEYVQPEAVENVPDWLNAIVPGIDIDYDATEEDAPIETEFVEEPVLIAPTDASAAPSAPGSDFQWLNTIVDEETRDIIPEAPMDFPESPAETPKSRFAFTRRPEWLRFSKAPAWMQSSQPAAAPQSDDFPDWPEDDKDGSELPDWLK